MAHLPQPIPNLGRACMCSPISASSQPHMELNICSLTKLIISTQTAVSMAILVGVCTHNPRAQWQSNSYKAMMQG